MDMVTSPVPDDKSALRRCSRRLSPAPNQGETRAADDEARESAIEMVIQYLKLQIAKLRRERFGARAERSRRLLERMDLNLRSWKPTRPRTIS